MARAFARANLAALTYCRFINLRLDRTNEPEPAYLRGQTDPTVALRSRRLNPLF